MAISIYQGRGGIGRTEYYDSFAALKASMPNGGYPSRIYYVKHPKCPLPIAITWDGTNWIGAGSAIICAENRYDTQAIPFSNPGTTYEQIFKNINNGLGYFTIPAGLVGYGKTEAPFTKIRFKEWHNIANSGASDATAFSKRLYTDGAVPGAYFPWSLPEVALPAGLTSRYGYTEFSIDHNRNLAGDQRIRQSWRHSFGIYNQFADDNNSMIYDLNATASPNLDYTIDNNFRIFIRLANPTSQMTYGCRSLLVELLP